MKLLKGLAAAAVSIAAFAGAAAAADRLTVEGSPLPGQSYAPGEALEIRIDAGGDDVLSAHTLLRPASTNILLMRDRDGFWTEWDGDRATLAESAARRDGDELVFKIFNAPPPGVHSMTITVAYRTAEGLKLGWFNAAERAE